MSQVEIKLPRGRLVSGHPMKLRDTTDPVTGQKKLNEHGQPKQECFIQVAVPKSDPTVQTVFAQMEQAAGRQMPVDPMTGLKSPINDPTGFKWKVTDGDSQHQDKKTGQWKQRPDYCLGQWLFNIKSHGWVPTVVYQTAPNQPHQEMLDPGMIKTGDYVDCIIRVEPNNAMGQQAGIYVNPGLVRFNEAGAAISTGAGLGASDADAMFAGSPAPAAPVQFPHAASYGVEQQPAMAPAPAQPMQPAMAPAPAQPMQPMQPAMAPAPAQPMQPAMPQPNYDPNFAAGPGGTVPTS